MTEPAKVLLTAFIGSDNLGDEAVFLSLVGALISRLTSVKLKVASVNPRETRRLLAGHGGNERVSVTSRSGFFLEVASHDVIIVGGGGIIQDQSSVLNLAYFLLQIQLAKVLKKIVVLAFVGIGPVDTRLGRFFARLVLSNLSLCVVRDASSRQLLDEIGVSGTAITCASDIALDLRCRDENGARPFRSRRYLLLSLRHWYGQSAKWIPASRKSGVVRTGTRLAALIDNMAAEIERVLAANADLDILAVPLFAGRDAIVHRALRDRLSPANRARLHIYEGVASPCAYLALAQSAECVIGMRLHSLILAAAASVPGVALSYSPKVAGFMQQLHLSEIVMDIANEPAATGLFDRVQTVLGNAAKFRHTVRERVKILQASNSAALAAVVEIVEGKRP